MANDIDMWEDLEQMDKRTKEYAEAIKDFTEKYIEGRKW